MEIFIYIQPTNEKLKKQKIMKCDYQGARDM